jgi:hypothetical protein
MIGVSVTFRYGDNFDEQVRPSVEFVQIAALVENRERV